VKLFGFAIHGVRAQRLGAELRGQLVDLEAAYAARGAARGFSEGALKTLPGDLLAFLRLGQPAWQAAREALTFMRGRPAVPVGQQLTHAFEEVTLQPPLAQSGKIFCVSDWSSLPTDAGTSSWAGACKVSSAVIGPGMAIKYPATAGSCSLSTRPALAAVIGSRPDDLTLKDESTPAAQDSGGFAAGFTLLQDVAVSDPEGGPVDPIWARNYDTFCPLGPALLTPDELNDPACARIRLLVNGQVQHEVPLDGLLRGLGVAFSRLRSRMSLQPGDIIAIWMGRSQLLKVGDIVRLEVDAIGVLENAVVQD